MTLLAVSGTGLAETAWQISDPMLTVTELRGERRDALDKKITASLALKATYEKPLEALNAEQEALLAEGLWFFHALPETDDLGWQQAFDVALTAIQDRYGLNDAHMEHFCTTFSFQGGGPNAPEWLVIFDTIDPQAFSTLGSYGAYVSARTGAVRHVYSHDAAG